MNESNAQASPRKRLTIWKYTLRDNVTTFDVPADYQVLDVQLQHGQPQLWLLVNPLAPTYKLTATIYGTGWDIELDKGGDIGWYAGTFQQAEGALVWHVFLKDDRQ